jgi:hypothetical protein
LTNVVQVPWKTLEVDQCVKLPTYINVYKWLIKRILSIGCPVSISTSFM